MSDIKFHRLSWMDLERDCIETVKKMKNAKIDVIIAISRGGLVGARIVSDLLDVKISHITISSYSNMKQEKEPFISEVPSQNFAGKSILIIDDVSDTGKTFERAVAYFKNFQVKHIYTFTPYIKPHTKFIPDFWIKEIDAWIIFPYDLRETKDSFMKMFGKEKTMEKLKEVGYEDWEIQELFENGFK